MKFCVFSLGCKVNQYEGQSLLRELVKRGFEATDKLERADVYILNTCSVTLEADKKSRQAVARALKLNPQARVAICGCSSQNDASKYENKPNVTIIRGTGGKMSIIDSIMSDIVPRVDIQQPPKTYEDDLTCELTKCRGFIKVQDGCDNFCSYCIIPYLRGRCRSRDLNSIMTEVRDMEKRTHEIVVTGIDVSSYGKDIGLTLADLAEAMNATGVRKRFSSLECRAIDERLLRTMKDGNWCDFFHLSLQSGSDSVLRRMNRKYTAEMFLGKCDLIRSFFPDAGISTDIITGFPGETDEEFEQTVRLAERARFSGIHVFPYSVRPGTAAAKMEQVDPAVRIERAERLRGVAARLRREFMLAHLGSESEVLTEDEDGGMVTGYTTNYIKVYASAPAGELVKCKLSRLYRDGIKGEPIS